MMANIFEQIETIFAKDGEAALKKFLNEYDKDPENLYTCDEIFEMRSQREEA